MSAAVGVSRTPVREAFQQLHGEGLITLLPRRGAMVRVVTAQELLEVYQARVVIESHAVRVLCAARRPVPPAMLDALRALRAAGTGNAAQEARLNTAFHTALVAAAGNGVVAELYRSLEARQERVAVTSITVDPGRHALIQAEHHELVDALGAGDPDRGVAVLERHLQPIRTVMARLPSTPPFT